MYVDFAAGRWVLLQNGNVRARACETNSGGESAEASANDDNFFICHFAARSDPRSIFCFEEATQLPDTFVWRSITRAVIMQAACDNFHRFGAIVNVRDFDTARRFFR